jgi:hypothetical protein
MGWTVNASGSALAHSSVLKLSLFLYDRSIDGASAAANIAKDAGVYVGAFRSDIGVPWLNVIEPMWRERPQAIAGITYDSALFCLKQLARSYRMACTFRFAALSPAASALETVVVQLLQAATYNGPPLHDFDQAAGVPVAWLLQPIAKNNQ